MPMPVYRILLSFSDDCRSECERASQIVRRVGEDHHEAVNLELFCYGNSGNGADHFAIDATLAFDLIVCVIGARSPRNEAASGATNTPGKSNEVSAKHTPEIGGVPDFFLFTKESEIIGVTRADTAEQTGWNALERFLQDWKIFGVNRQGEFTTSINRYRDVEEFEQTFERLLRQKCQRFAQPIVEYVFPRGEALTQTDHFFQRFGQALSMEVRSYVYDWIWQIRIQGQKERRFVAKMVFSITGALVAAVIFGSISFHRYQHFEDARRIALAEKSEAQRITRQAVAARYRAESLVHAIVADIGDNLNPVRRMDLLDGALRGIECYNQETGGNRQDQPISVLRVAALDDQADLLRDEGKLEEAVHSRQEACEIIRRFIKEGQERTRWSDHLAQELQTIGDIQVSLNRVDPAVSSYKIATDNLQELADLEPENLTWKNRLVVVLDKLANAYFGKREWSKAIGSYQRERKILQTLMEKEPNDSSRWLLLSNIFNRLGELYVNVGAPEPATASYKGALDVARKLVNLNPGNVQLRRNLLASLERTGYALEVEGKLPEALDFYDEQLDSIQKLVSEERTNKELRRDMSISLDHIAGVLRAQARPQMALRYYQQSLEISQQMANDEPSNRTRQHDVALELVNQGSVLADLGRPDDALKISEQGHAIFQKLCDDEPNNSSYQTDLAVCLGRLGDLLKADGQLDQALQYYADSLQICQKLAQLDQNNNIWRQDFALALQRVGETLTALEKPEDGLKNYQQSCEIFERLLESNRANPAWQEFLANGYLQSAKILQHQDKDAQVAPTLVRCLEMLRELQGSEQLDDFGLSLLGETEQILAKQ
ncbi:MAG TPA: tetratricopeptide repeat protein [Chthoniobacterales bacterium]|nr:tetratricopeptide repeat protein [Chthoniobacterales bacterium]